MENAEVQTNEASTSGNEESQQMSPAELQKQVENLMAVNAKLQSKSERLENESKEHAGKYRKLRDSISSQEKEELEKGGKLQELLAKEREEYKALKENFSELKNNSLKQNINFQVSQYAQDAYKVERLVSAVLDSDAVKISEVGTSFEGVEEAIAALRNEEPYLFKQNAPASMVNKNPSAKAPQGKSLNELNKSEREMLLKESIKSMLNTGR